MTTLREAAKQAYKILREIHPGNMTPMASDAWIKAIWVLIEALNKTDPEPVAWMDRDGDIYPMPETEGWRPPHKLLYTHPPQRQPLTDEELFYILHNRVDYLWSHIEDCGTESKEITRLIIEFARAIERAHGIGEKE